MNNYAATLLYAVLCFGLLALPAFAKPKPVSTEGLSPSGNGVPPMTDTTIAWPQILREIQEMGAHLGQGVNSRMTYFPLGQLGVIGTGVNGDGILVCGIQKQARTGIQLYDRIFAVNGVRLDSAREDEDFTLRILGKELDKAGAADSVLKLKVIRVERGGKNPKELTLDLPIKARGSFGDTNPQLTEKAKALNNVAAAAYIKAKVETTGDWPAMFGSYMCGIGLLGSESEEGLRSLASVMDLIEQRHASAKVIHEGKLNIKTWYVSMATIFAAEYYWATGDEKAFRTLETLADYLNGFFTVDGTTGHRRQSAMYNSDNFAAPCGLALLAMTVAEKAGVAVNLKTIDTIFTHYGPPELQGAKESNKNSVSYGGRLESRQAGAGAQSAFRTATVMMAAHLRDQFPYTRKAMGDYLASTIPYHMNTHATPSLGEYFGCLAIGLNDFGSIPKLVAYKAPKLTLSWDCNDDVQYMPSLAGKSKG